MKFGECIHNVRRLIVFIVVVSVVGIACCVPLSVRAQGQAILRNQARITNQAISRQIHEALRPTLVVRNAAGPIDSLEATADGSMVAFIMRNGGVRIWDLHAGREVSRIRVGRIRAVSLSSISRTVALLDESGQLSVWDGIGGQMRQRFEGIGGAGLALALSPDGSTLAAAADNGTIQLWSTTDKRPRLALAGHNGPVGALMFSPSGNLLVSGGDDGTVRIWDINAGTPVSVLSTKDVGVSRVFFFDEKTVFSGGADGNIRKWRIGTSDPAATIKVGGTSIRSLAVRSDGLIFTMAKGQEPGVWKENGNRVAVFKGSGGELAGIVAISAEHTLTGGVDGRGRLWDARSGTAVAQLILSGGGWSVIDSKGRYDGSDRGLDDVARQAEQETFEMGNFSEPYYEPSLLAKLLWAPKELLTPDAPEIEAGIPAPPQMELAVEPSAPDGPGPAKVTVTAAGRGDGVETIILYHNGKAVAANHVIAQDDAIIDRHPVRTVTFGVDLVGGSNNFRAVALGKSHIESIPAENTVQVPAPPTPPPTLHVFVVGINRYANPALTLNYAVADARGLSEWARHRGKPLFGKVELHELYDDQADRESIRRVFAELRRTQPNDVVVVYLAGHGEVATSTWNFLPMEFARNLVLSQAGDDRGASVLRDTILKALVADGIPDKELREEIVAINAQRILVLIDACKSGNVKTVFDGGADRKRLSALSRQTGIHVLAATGKEQLAAEIESIGHGVFTFALLEALQGAADNNPVDGVVTAKELMEYSSDHVPAYAVRYADNEQFPTIFSQGPDFALSLSGVRRNSNASSGQTKRRK